MQHHISDFIGTSVVLIANCLTFGCVFWDLVDFINLVVSLHIVRHD